MHTPLLDDIDLCRWVAEELPIRFLGDAALSAECEPYHLDEFGTEEMLQLAGRLVSTLKKYRARAGTGRGLAANQIGITRRMIVVWLGDEPTVMLNPEIVHTEGRGSYWESCISTGALVIGEVVRPWKGSFLYQDLEGEPHAIEADEWQTRLLLHEIDHLDGKHCVDRYEKGTVKFVSGGKEEVLGYALKKLSGD